MLLATFLLTVFRDLTEGIVVGFVIGAVLFIDRMAGAITIEGRAPLVPEDRADEADGDRQPYDPALAADPDIVVYRIAGAFFFGAASTVGAVLDRIADRHKAFILDLSAVPFLDSTAANTIAGLGREGGAARGAAPDHRGDAPHPPHPPDPRPAGAARALQADGGGGGTGGPGQGRDTEMVQAV